MELGKINELLLTTYHCFETLQKANSEVVKLLDSRIQCTTCVRFSHMGKVNKALYDVSACLQDVTCLTAWRCAWLLAGCGKRVSRSCREASALSSRSPSSFPFFSSSLLLSISLVRMTFYRRVSQRCRETSALLLFSISSFSKEGILLFKDRPAGALLVSIFLHISNP